MDSVLHDWLWRWEWRPEVVLTLAALGAVYVRGWWHLRRGGHRRLASGWRLAAYLAGLSALAVALLSPIDALQALLFLMHMVQHELLMMVAAPLLLLAEPFPILLWGLPPGVRRAVGDLLARGGVLRQILARLATPWLSWAAYVVTLWVWHAPAAYDASLRNEWIHDLEHMTFFWSAMLFWWHVVGAAPRIHGFHGYGMRIVYVLAALAQNEVLGTSITFARRPLYAYYTTVPRLWGLSVMDDQMLGGEVMWIAGGMMYVLTALILLARFLAWEERRTERQIATDIGVLP